jgi:hypothetical protein
METERINCVCLQSFADINIDAQICLIFNIGFQVGHFEMVVDPVDYEVGEPRILSLALKKATEKLEALLAEVVTENFKGHEGLITCERLSEKCQAEVIYLVVAHVNVNQTLVHGDCLSNSFGTIV